MLEPDVLLLDEPAANLDADGAGLVRGLIAQARSAGRTIVLVDHDLPEPDALIGRITVAHDLHRPVAVHCVTRAELVLALAALDAAGTLPGDRIEHACVTPPDAVLVPCRLT